MAGQADKNKTTLVVNSKEYTVDTTKMPYFASHTSRTDHDIPHFAVALHCVEMGFHRAFDALGDDLSSYPVLCQTLKLLGVDVLGPRSLAEVINGFKSFRFDDEESKAANTKVTTDSVFRLLYMYHMRGFGSRDRCKVFDAVIYIVAHRYFFAHYTRSVVRQTFITMMDPTAKQLAAIEQWPVYDEDGRTLKPLVVSDADDLEDDDENELPSFDRDGSGAPFYRTFSDG